MTGIFLASASSMLRVIFSPTTIPMLPPMKPYSIAETTVPMPLIVPVAVITASQSRSTSGSPKTAVAQPSFG